MLWVLPIPVVLFAIYVAGAVVTWEYQWGYWLLHTEEQTRRVIARHVALRWPWTMWRWYWRGWGYRYEIFERCYDEPA